MLAILQLFLGFLVTLAAALAMRIEAGAGIAPTRHALVEIGAFLTAWVPIVALTGRPVLGGVALAVVAGTLIVCDAVKRQTLREPLVYADAADLRELIRHPVFYLPFAGDLVVVLGVAAAIGALAGAVALEPRLDAVPVPHGPIAAVLIVAGLLWIARRHGTAIGNWLAGLAVTEQPLADAAAFGPLLIHAAYVVRARRDRGRRRAALRHVPAPAVRRIAGEPLVIAVQSESFVDIRRMPGAHRLVELPAYDRCRNEAWRAGRLTVPAWGANTLRSEFAFLTGVGEDRLGLDRFNPYATLVDGPTASLAWDLEARGFRTACLHPYDRRFYGRDRVMPLLGFETFLGQEAFPGAERMGNFITDEALAARALDLAATRPGPAFLFLITVQNHGPFKAPHDAGTAPTDPPIRSAAAKAELAAYAAGLVRTERMLERLRQAALDRRQPVLLAYYGDHVPTLGTAYGETGYDDPRTDYFLWRNDLSRHGGPESDADITDLRRLLVSEVESL